MATLRCSSALITANNTNGTAAIAPNVIIRRYVPRNHARSTSTAVDPSIRSTTPVTAHCAAATTCPDRPRRTPPTTPSITPPNTPGPPSETGGGGGAGTSAPDPVAGASGIGSPGAGSGTNTAGSVNPATAGPPATVTKATTAAARISRRVTPPHRW